MEQTNYNVDYFIKKFEAIPEGRWCSGTFECDGSYCASGFCGMKNEYSSVPKELKALIKILKPLKITIQISRYTNHQKDINDMYNIVTVINDCHTNEYQQDTPKQRILAALYDIKKLQQPAQPEWKDITSDLAVLPVNETSDLSLQTIQP